MPINLIGNLHKILAKCLANISKLGMERIIGPTQSAFITGRNISESIMAYNEMLHLMKKSNSASFVFKVDFEKAFDYVRWDFLSEMMGKLGFCSKCIGWIQECLSSASVSVLLNGSPISEFPMCCGLRQGDSLSPFRSSCWSLRVEYISFTVC